MDSSGPRTSGRAKVSVPACAVQRGSQCHLHGSLLMSVHSVSASSDCVSVCCSLRTAAALVDNEDIKAGNLASYSDGSVENDLPMQQLSELFNVNHFIVSQVRVTRCAVQSVCECVRACFQLLFKFVIISASLGSLFSRS